MKTSIVLNELVVSSSLTPEEIKKIEKFDPEVLVERDDNGDPEFAYRTGKDGHLTRFGVMFDTVDNDGKAAVKVPIKCDGTKAEKKEWVANEYGAALKRAKHMEDTYFADTIAAIDRNIQAVMDNLEVIV